MKVIVCGAGQVGFSISSYLIRENNDVTVIDHNADIIEKLNNEIDVQGICGHASNPNVLDAAGAREADLIVAVTEQDEVNMVACQIAHSLFNVPKKIARVRERAYLNPAWANLFSRTHMPIDKIISPEVEVAKSIYDCLKTPGTTNLISLADNMVFLAGTICTEKCPVLNTQLKQIPILFPNVPLIVCLIAREGEIIVPTEDDQVFPDDEVFFFTDKSHLKRALTIFGHEEEEARTITLMGGGNVGKSLIELIHKKTNRINLKVIEKDEERAEFLSTNFPDIVVLHGSGINREILAEANIRSTETFIAVTEDDENNILASLIAKQAGCSRVISLTNTSTYTSLTARLGIDATVSPKTSTVSTIMQHVRRGRIKTLQAIYDGAAEIIEAEVAETSHLVNMSVVDLELPSDVIIGMIVRGDEVLLPTPDTVIQALDHIVLMARAGKAHMIEEMFTIHVDLF
ncbi:MAG: Trk system potassium transporter TrkA [Alphaproteobacteria bacterium]|jgi:trk system potassium uptake protein TrkA|nr:Trk system potassium transporter TrkA [Alphaproteobacteria bacterium]MDP7222692.1 Trk system potassium transporter TrkA [Alphaproteobacteria bacterium]